MQVAVLDGARLLKKETVKLTPMNPLSTIVTEVRTTNHARRVTASRSLTRLRRKRLPPLLGRKTCICQ